MGRALFYVTGHGFGHATRTRALIAALRARLDRDLAIHVRSDAPHWIFTDRDADVTCSAAAVDPGVLQPNGLDLDLPRTLAAHEAFVAGWDERVAEEAAFVREQRATLVVGDVPPLAFAAARAAGVPAVAVANFSWDWIIAAWADREPRFGAIAAHYQRAYAEAETLFRLPLHGDLAAFASTVDVPFLVNRSKRDRTACRADLGLAAADSRRVVLVSFGGLGPGTVSVREHDQRRTIGVNNRPADPVVDELYDWKATVQPPRDISMRTRPVVLGAKHRDIMPPLELTTELKGIDLGPSLMTWEKIVDRVQNVETARVHEGVLGPVYNDTLAYVVLPTNHRHARCL